MKKVILLLVLIVSGCASIHDPYPEDYDGPSAIIGSSENRIDQSTVELFYLEKINHKLILNTMGASRGLTQGQGFNFSTQLIETAVPTLSQVFTIVGTRAHAAPIETLFSDNFFVRGNITFTPDAHTEYVVEGILGENYSAVWIKNIETGQIIGEKIEASSSK